MADEHSETRTPETVEQAIDRVLEAEREAEQAIADCAREARALVAGARERAQHIARRADARITRLHECSARLLAQHLHDLEQAVAATAPVAPITQDPQRLEQVVDRAAAVLSGAVPAPSAGRDREA